MAQFHFKLPDVGEGIAEAEITAWHVKPGDLIEEDAPFVDVMTDKATVEIPAPVGGRVVAVTVELGAQAAVGSIIATIETEASAVPEAGEVATPATAANEPPPQAGPAEALAPAPMPVSTPEPRTEALPHQAASAGARRAPTGQRPLASP
ncbi:MAG TPA: biotin/lipoyl-containing protein, partial [Caulobacteraceae bacterium]|nr:biotin/lipoyl-containing protein [Caulobacteraceae bacterium]